MKTEFVSTRPKYFLGLLGLPGVGKSTTQQSLGLLNAGMVGIWTDKFHSAETRIASYIHRLAVSGEHSIALACQVEALVQRARLQRTASMLNCVDEPIEAVLAHTLALSELGILPADQKETWMMLYEFVRENLPRAHFLSLLTCDRAARQLRTSERGRQRDASVDNEYLDALERALEHILKESGATVLRIDTTALPPVEVATRLLALTNWPLGGENR